MIATETAGPTITVKGLTGTITRQEIAPLLVKEKTMSTPVPTPAPAAMDLAAMFSQFLQSQPSMIQQSTMQQSTMQHTATQQPMMQPEVTPSRPLPPPAAVYETPAAVRYEAPIASRPPSQPMHVKPRPPGNTPFYSGSAVLQTQFVGDGVSIKAYCNDETTTPQGYVRKANHTLTVVIDNDVLPRMVS